MKKINFELIIGYIREILLYLGMVSTITCLILFMFMITNVWFIILAGLSGLSVITTYEKYKVLSEIDKLKKQGTRLRTFFIKNNIYIKKIKNNLDIQIFICIFELLIK